DRGNDQGPLQGEPDRLQAAEIRRVPRRTAENECRQDSAQGTARSTETSGLRKTDVIPAQAGIHLDRAGKFRVARAAARNDASYLSNGSSLSAYPPSRFHSGTSFSGGMRA